MRNRDLVKMLFLSQSAICMLAQLGDIIKPYPHASWVNAMVKNLQNITQDILLTERQHNAVFIDSLRYEQPQLFTPSDTEGKTTPPTP